MNTIPKTQTANNYGEVLDYLTRGVPFRHRSISGHYDGTTYTVLSYSTVVATWPQGEPKWLTSTKYSVTTSKHMGYIRRAWNVQPA